MVTLEKHEDRLIIYRDQNPMGSVALYHNPYHMKNCYLKLGLSCYLNEISRELFWQIAQEVNRPLQVMISSEELEQIAFLNAGGFSCKRKCYEVEATLSDLATEFPGGSSCHLLSCVRGSVEYTKCCKLMYDTYIQNHALINPWTAGFEVFCEKLPDRVLYSEHDGEIFGLAFVEENEIAFLCGRDPSLFRCFAYSLVVKMLGEYRTICFECDDCDWAAMIVRSMFANQNEESYDTYVLELP